MSWSICTGKEFGKHFNEILHSSEWGLSDILSSRGRVTLVLLAQSTAAHLLTPIYPRHFSKRFKISRVFVSFVAHLSLVSKATTSIVN
jgi:hypothetical protein